MVKNIIAKMKGRSILNMKVDIVCSDSVDRYRYRDLSVVKENGFSYLCYEYTTENTKLAKGMVLGLIFNSLLLGVLASDNSEHAYCDLLTGKRVYPDNKNSVKYLGAIIEISSIDCQTGHILGKGEVGSSSLLGSSM